jgi:LruC domain-containing protein
MMSMPYDPFIFATPNYYHGDQLPFQPGRTWEVHLLDTAPTEKFNHAELWGLGVDASNEIEGRYFKTENNLPWAIMIPDEWQWPAERVDVVTSYPKFKAFAESGGEQDKNWYKTEHANQNRIYQP